MVASKNRLFSDSLEEEFAVLIREVATGIGTELIEKTPIDTGRAKSNWKGSINSPIGGAVPPLAPGRFGSTKESTITIATVLLKNSFKKAKAKDTLYITNNLQYIGRLNDGYSTQAPAMFIETALAKNHKVTLFGKRTGKK